jgi:hypothetical protein
MNSKRKKKTNRITDKHNKKHEKTIIFLHNKF